MAMGMHMNIVLCCVFAAVSGAGAADTGSAIFPLKSGWRFCRALDSGREHDFTFDRMSGWLDDAMSGRPLERQPGVNHPFISQAFKDGSWRSVSVPHDWGIEGAFGQGVGGFHDTLIPVF